MDIGPNGRSFMAGFFQKIFGNQNSETDKVPTQPLNQKENEDNVQKAAGHLEPPQLIVGCAQSVGKQRDHNEDALFTMTTTLASDRNSMPFGLYIVADGMGGHKHGEVASNLAVRAMASQITRKLYSPLLSIKPLSPTESIQEIMRDGIEEAHQAINKEAPGGGTTLTAVLVLGDQLTIAHIGDSRAYTISATGEVQTLTRDHSLVKRLVELGEITVDEAAVHPQRNVLYRALGQGDVFDADISTSPLPHSGHLLLCSDGLWGVVPEDNLARMVAESSSPQQACQNMVEAANEAGGPDNITAILVRMLD
jgi:serine/threonine protein phosphatase PrpC